MMNKLTLLIIGSLLATACDQIPVDHNGGKTNRAGSATTQIHYTKDPRTGLCFAFVGRSDWYRSLTHVPCEALRGTSVEAGR
jgi:hypothetical protein